MGPARRPRSIQGHPRNARALHRRRSRGPVHGSAAQEGGPAERRAGRRAQPAVRHVRVGCRVLRPDARQSRRGRSRDRRRDRGRVQPLGRHRRPLQGPHDHVGRPRVLRHRPQAAAQHPAGALRGTRRRARVRAGRGGRRRGRARVRRRRRHRVRRPQQPHPHEVLGCVRPRHRRAPLPLRVARHEEAVPGVHVRVRRDAARLVPGARVPVRRRHVDVHRRDARGHVARGGARGDVPGGRDRVLRAPVRAVARRAPAAVERRAPARLGDLDPLPARRVPHVGPLERGSTAATCP